MCNHWILSLYFKYKRWTHSLDYIAFICVRCSKSHRWERKKKTSIQELAPNFSTLMCVSFYARPEGGNLNFLFSKLPGARAVVEASGSTVWEWNGSNGSISVNFLPNELFTWTSLIRIATPPPNPQPRVPRSTLEPDQTKPAWVWSTRGRVLWCAAMSSALRRQTTP